MADRQTAFGPFVLDRERQALLRDGDPVSIGHRGYLILEALVDANGETVSKSALLERGWPGLVVEEANLTVQVGAFRKAMGADGEALIVTVPRTGYRLVRPEPAHIAKTSTHATAATIAVMPFANMSGDAEQDYFADGMVDEIITALSRFRTFTVISRTSSFVFKGKAVDIRAAGKELGVRYVLEGSVRRSGSRLRVTAQLIDAETGAHLWAEKFEGTTEDIFAFQDAITESVVGLVEPTIRKAEIDRARRKRPESLEAYDLFLRALPLVYGMEVDDYTEALRLLEQATTLDPTFAVAIGYAAWTAEKVRARVDPFAASSLHARAIALAHAALDAGRDDPFVVLLAGWVLLAMTDDPLGVEMVRRGLAANPNNLVALNLGGITNLIAGDIDASAECYARAYRLSPGAPDAFWSLTGLGWVELQRANDAEALDWFDRSLATGSDWPFTWLGKIAALAFTGRKQEAKEGIERLQQIAPQWSQDVLLTGPQGVGWSRLREGLRLAITLSN